ncbi:glycolate oxidase subunit GlcE [Eoetvoesiella caeni]
MNASIASKVNGQRLAEQVAQALEARAPLRIRGGDSKAFLGRPVVGQEIDLRMHRGVVSYDPTELVITVRAGTPVAELNAVLAAESQMLPCEPPVFGGRATVGGMVASGLAGPRRPWAGSVRDFVLGCRLITGQAKTLRFGGEVMKNVAGYDVSRLIAGSFGCLGILTEVSLKVLPKPRACQSVSLELAAGEALRKLSSWRRAALPVTGAFHADGRLYIRFEGGEGSVRQALDLVGGEQADLGIWEDLREQRLGFFADERPLWRVSVPAMAPVGGLPGNTLLDWGGAQRWVKSDAPASVLREMADQAGGNACCYTSAPGVESFHPLSAALLRFHQQLKAKMDPGGIFNPGRMYAGL